VRLRHAIPGARKETTMKLERISRILLLASLAVLAFAIVGVSGSRPNRQPQSAPVAGGSHCTLVSGTVMTNFGGFDQNTTLGTATGDLRGAVTGTILGYGPGPNNTVIFHIQHHWVTETGDTLFFDPATATVVPVPPSQTMFAIVTDPVHLRGGTGKFAGATGDLTNIGEVDLSSGTVFRYTGQVCFAGQD